MSLEPRGPGKAGNSGLYVHVPFCSAVCPYCDFSVVIGAERRRQGYVERLLREIEGREIPRGSDTLYFGGGTPSRLLAEDVDRIRRAFPLEDGARIFFEANPEDVSEEAVADWRACGVGTLSLGVQSFEDDALRFLGRRHSAAEARRGVEIARDAAFETLSFDLIYGLPGQGIAAWREQLARAVALQPDHLSCYQLTVHDGTLFGRMRNEGRLVEVGEDLQADLFRETHRFLAEAGYEGYEVSNFARGREHRSRHNEKYWNHTPYLGFGPSAHSFDGRARFWNRRTVFQWQKSVDRGESPVDGREVLDDEALLLETLMLRLHTLDGLDLAALHARFGCDLLDSNQDLIARLIDEGIVELDGANLRPTLEGLAVADGVVRSFCLPDYSQQSWPPTLA